MRHDDGVSIVAYFRHEAVVKSVDAVLSMHVQLASLARMYFGL